MAIIDRPKKSYRPAAAPKSARVDHAFDTSVEDWLARISDDQRAIAAAEAARLTAASPLPTITGPILTSTEGAAPVIGDICALDPDDILLLHSAAKPAGSKAGLTTPFGHELIAERRSTEERDADALRKAIAVRQAIAVREATGAVDAPPKEQRSPRRRARAWGVATALLGVAAAAVSVVIVLGSFPGGQAQAPTAAVAAASPIAAAQDWVAGNVAPTDRVLADDAVSTGLVGAGFAAGSVLPLSLLAADPDPEAYRTADFVLVTDGVRADADLAPALADSRVVAAFGTGAAAVEVRRLGTETAGTVAAGTAEQRAALGAQLAANPALTLAPEAAATLAAGQVDQRIVILLGEALADRPLAVASFPAEGATPAGEPEDVRHRVLLSGYDGDSLLTDPAAVAAATAWLQDLKTPYRPLTIETGDQGVLATLSISTTD